MTPIIADWLKLMALLAVFSLGVGTLLSIYLMRGGKLWREPDGKE
jgi:hypothetical protein